MFWTGERRGNRVALFVFLLFPRFSPVQIYSLLPHNGFAHEARTATLNCGIRRHNTTDDPHNANRSRLSKITKTCFCLGFLRMSGFSVTAGLIFG